MTFYFCDAFVLFYLRGVHRDRQARLVSLRGPDRQRRSSKSVRTRQIVGVTLWAGGVERCHVYGIQCLIRSHALHQVRIGEERASEGNEICLPCLERTFCAGSIEVACKDE